MKRNISKKTVAPKHIPQRTCVACRTTRPKRELVRLVLTPAGELHVDATGKLSGRGGYLCRRAECWETAIKGDTLSRALKTGITTNNKETLIIELQKIRCIDTEENAIGKSY